MNRCLFFLLVLAGCAQAQPTYMQQQADICRVEGGEPVEIYASYAHGLVMGCRFEEAR